MSIAPKSWDSQLSILIPAKNEEQSIAKVLGAIQLEYPNAEVVVIDNGSDDETAKIAQAHGARVISDARQGKGFAMQTGAASATRPFILFHDADTEYSVKDSKAVALSAISAGVNLPVMSVGVRVWPKRLPVSSFAANMLIRGILALRFGRAPSDILSGTRCMSKNLFIALNPQSGSFAIETEINRLALTFGAEIREFPVRYAPRNVHEGKKIKFRHLMPILKAALDFRTIPATDSVSARAA